MRKILEFISNGKSPTGSNRFFPKQLYGQLTLSQNIGPGYKPKNVCFHFFLPVTFSCLLCCFIEKSGESIVKNDSPASKRYIIKSWSVIQFVRL